MITIVMGVSGSGKTLIGQKIASKLKVPFYDADEYHSKENVLKMSEGIPLDDKDRAPWLKHLAALTGNWEYHGGAVLACSALKESYRKILSQNVKDIRWVFLDGTKETILSRMTSREDHFMKVDLLDSQLQTLEPPKYGMRVDISEHPDSIIQSLKKHLSRNA